MELYFYGRGNEMILKILRFIIAFIIGTICYAIGFVIGGLFMDFTNSFILILPATIDLDASVLTASALAANLLGYSVFSVIDQNKNRSIAFVIWLIVIAGAYTTLCFISGDFHLLTYPITCVIIDGIILAQIIHKVHESEDKQKAEIESLKKELKEKELEQKYPEVIELKKQKEFFVEHQKKLDAEVERMKSIISQTKKEDIISSYRRGEISEERYNLLMNDYEVCEVYIMNAPNIKKDTEKMMAQIDEKIDGYRRKAEGEKQEIKNRDI